VGEPRKTAGALSRADAAAYTRISQRQFDILATEREIPRTKLGARRYSGTNISTVFGRRYTGMSRDDIGRSVAIL